MTPDLEQPQKATGYQAPGRQRDLSIRQPLQSPVFAPAGGSQVNVKTPRMMLVPIVIEQTGRGEHAYDIYSRLLHDNIIFIGVPIDDNVANLVIAQMLYLQQEDPERDVQLYINSPGGSITAGMEIYDTMQYIKNDVMTLCVGQAASMAALLLSAGSPGSAWPCPIPGF
jgi:hypothetical protein